MGAWGALLNGVFLTGACDDESYDCADGTGPATPAPTAELSFKPDGLGIPALRTTDVTYPQRDGIRFGADWYENRIVTLADVTMCPHEGCSVCGSVPKRWRTLSKAWSRSCDRSELVIFTDCHGEPDPDTGEVDRSLTGPFGVVGRPRAMLDTTPRSASGCRQATLRFDSEDHRLYILDECGTPGSGEECAALLPGLPPLGEACVTPPETVDLMVNGSFEDPDLGGTTDPFAPTGWTLDGGTADPQQGPNATSGLAPADGDHWLLLSMTNDGAVASQTVAASPGEVLTLSMSVTGDTGQNVYVELIPMDGGTPLFGGVQAIVVTESGVWQEARVTLAIPDAADGALVRLLVIGSTPGSLVGLDGGSLTVPILGQGGLCLTPDGMCFTTAEESPAGSTVLMDNIGTECACPTITLTGRLTNPAIENVTTGARIDYNATVETGQVIIIDTSRGTAVTDTGADRTSFLSGDTTGFCMPEGENEIRLLAFGAGDDGMADVCFRPSVLTT